MTATAIKERGETPFKEAGDDVVIRFRNSDLKRIESVLGPSFFKDILAKFLNDGDTEFAIVDMLLLYGVKKGEKREPYEVPENVLDNIPVHDLQEKLVEGLMLSMRGMTMKAYIEEVRKHFEEAAANGELNPPETTLTDQSSTILTNSGAGVSEQDFSGQTTSGQ